MQTPTLLIDWYFRCCAMPTGSQCTIVVSMRTLGDAAATQNRIESIGDRLSKNSKAQVGPFGGLLAFFCPCGA